MEHNEYSIYKVTYKGNQRTGYHENQEEFVITGKKDYESTVYVVAPTNEEIALPLIKIILRKSSWDVDKFEVISFIKEAIHTIIRIESDYRSRM